MNNFSITSFPIIFTVGKVRDLLPADQGECDRVSGITWQSDKRKLSQYPLIRLFGIV